MRKCISRDTGQEYAVKIIDKSQDEAITESIMIEKRVLGSLPQHKHISEWMVSILVCDQCLVKIGQIGQCVSNVFRKSIRVKRVWCNIVSIFNILMVANDHLC